MVGVVAIMASITTSGVAAVTKLESKDRAALEHSRPIQLLYSTRYSSRRQVGLRSSDF
jgi:hypothetical protein